MSISVVCRNPVRFDKDAGTYVACGHTFSAPDDLAGKTVKCPQCGGKAKVATSSSQAAPVAPPEDEEEDLFGDAAMSPSSHVAAAPPVDKVKPALADEDDGDAELVTPVSAGKCPNCGADMSVDSPLCKSCAYHRKLHPKFDSLAELSDEEDMTGAERWFRERLAMGENVQGVLVLTKVTLAAAYLSLLTIIYMFTNLVWTIVFVALTVGLLIYLVRAGWRFDLPSLVMAMGRTFGWRALEPSFRKLRALDMRGAEFGDMDVARMDTLRELEALDLEGTDVTDLCLPHIARMRKLRFLVVRKTKVTAKGELLLQRASPEVWIWR